MTGDDGVGMAEDNKSAPIVKSDETLFSIIDVLHEPGEVGITEIAEQTGFAKSTVHKHLKTLEKHGYVVKQGKFRLGLRFLTIGGTLRDQNEMYRSAITTVEELTEKTDKVISFVVREGENGVFIYSSNDKYGLRKTAPLGDRYPIHQNAAGKAILAELTDAEIDEICTLTGLPRATDKTITTKKKLFDEIDQIRNRGYAISDEERIQGFKSVSAAVNSKETSQIGGIALACPSTISTNKIHDDYADWVLEAANELELQLEYR